MNSWRTLCTFVLASLASLTVSAAEVTISDVVEAWKRREKSTNSFSCKTWELSTAGKGTLLLASNTNDPEKVIPAEDHDRIIERTIIVDGDQMRHVRIGVAWDDDADGFVPETMISVADGTIAKSLHRCDRGTEMRSTGFIHHRPGHPDRFCLYLGPVLRHFRPFSPSLGTFSPERWKLVDEGVALNGSKCILIREGQQTDIRYNELFVDPEKDFALVRYTSYFHGRLENQLSTTFSKDTKLGWIPDSWEVYRYSNAHLADSAVGSLEGVEINIPIAGDSFDVIFPADTMVNDHLARKVSLVLATGEWQIVSDFGRRTSLKPQTTSVVQIGTKRGRFSESTLSMWFLSVVLIVISGALGVFCIRRRTARLLTAVGFCLGLGVVLDPERSIYCALETKAKAACGVGCAETDCYEAVDGTEIVLEFLCNKTMNVDPPGGTTGGATSTVRFEVVMNDPGCDAGGGLGGIRVNCPPPTGNWEVSRTACKEFCYPDP